MWVRQALNENPRPPHGFQFTHPCGCDPIAQPPFLRASRFNSRTRVGATVFRAQMLRRQAVSIHAPVWVRRFFSLRSFPPFDVSIHAPVWVRPACCHAPGLVDGFQFTHPCGCDTLFCPGATVTESFNSRTRVGATGRGRKDKYRHAVSIHAPVWVRRATNGQESEKKGFNSRTRVGATGKWSCCQKAAWFQFTHPCGCDG